MSYYYWHNDNDGIWLLSKTPSWSKIDHHCKGDVVWRMAIYALITGDASVIKALIRLLNSHKRWPDSLNQDTDSRNRIDYWTKCKKTSKIKAEVGNKVDKITERIVSNITGAELG